MRCTICSLSARPRPVPPCRAPWAPWLNGRKSRSTSSACIPAPVSWTARRSRAVTPPGGVGANGHRHAPGVGELEGVAHEVHDDLPQPVRVSHDEQVVAAVEGEREALADGDRPERGGHLGGHVAGAEGAARQGTAVVSALDRSRTSLSSESNDSPELRARPTYSAWREVRPSTSSASSMPRTPLSGVRISWLAAAGKAVFARVAASASSRAEA